MTKLLCAVTGIAIFFCGCAYAQEESSVEDLLRQLKPKTGKATRSIDLKELEAKTKNRIEVVERADTGLKSAILGPVAPELSEFPTVEIALTFGYNSSEVTQDSLPSLVRIAKVLNDPSLAGSKFLIAGHTDAVGSNAYNQELSKKRAYNVLRLLVTAFSVRKDSVVALGFGEEQLKNTENPDDSANRRVEVVNLGNIPNL